jgi:uncharacterized protein (UPF0548 family)
MILFTRPSDSLVREFIARQKTAKFSYREIGASKRGAPAGYNVDHNRIRLGEGADTFARAVQAIQRWEMFNLGWVQLFFNDTPIEVGATVAVQARHLGFYSLSACRIVYLLCE